MNTAGIMLRCELIGQGPVRGKGRAFVERGKLSHSHESILKKDFYSLGTDILEVDGGLGI